MRLLYFDDMGMLRFQQFYENDIPQYAILSHTWGLDSEEVTFQDLLDGKAEEKIGYQKITFCGKQASRHDLKYFWIDT
jgi:hypothetical protein